MAYRSFAISLRLEDRPVLVVGGGPLALEKVRLLAGRGANLTVVARRTGDEIAALAAEGTLTLIQRDFAAADARGQVLAVVATAGADDAAIAAEARAAGALVNVPDNIDLSDFYLPAIVERGPVTVAISTDGASPALARRIRTQIEALLPARLGDLAELAANFRDTAKALITDPVARRRFWERLIDGPAADLALAGDLPAAKRAVMSELAPAGAQEIKGIINIVGAGPGNPDLLTLEALRLMQQADIVLYDELVGADVLDRVRRGAERVNVGKQRDRHTMPQESINELMVREARAGKRVLRLKGGDPFVFGRGGEEADYARQRRVDVTVTPGITAALGCAAAAGIPLTHRDHASAVTFVTGHGKDGEPLADWAALAGEHQTVVIYMGRHAAGRIAERLIQAGRYAGTPVAVIENGTRANQRISTGTLAQLGELATHHDGGPALLIVGDVVRQAKSWAPDALAHTAAY